MKELFLQYLLDLYRSIPQVVYEGLLSVFILGLVVILALKGFSKGWRVIAGLMFTEFVVLLYCSMVGFRHYSEEAGHDFHPFWSYMSIYNGRKELIPENVMNVVVFLIVGLLLGCAFRSMTWWKTLLIGGGISVSIESMQYFLKRGFAETDDVMHNTLGCLIGYGFYSLIRLVYERLYKRSVAIL